MLGDRERLKRLAVGCVHLLVNRATLEFPGTTVAAPSSKVVVLLVPPGSVRQQDAVWFPFEVTWDYWHKVAVPILGDSGLRGYLVGKVPGEMDLVIDRFVESLLVKATAEGYSSLGIPTAPVVLDAPGEPVNRPG